VSRPFPIITAATTSAFFHVTQPATSTMGTADRVVSESFTHALNAERWYQRVRVATMISDTGGS
jgi:hypothetical protein